MATPTSIPLSEYLNTSYQPECEYIAGELKERTSCMWCQGFLQAFLAAFINRNWRAWQVVAGTEVRVRVSSRYPKGETVSLSHRT